LESNMTESVDGIPTGRVAELTNAGFVEMPDPLARKKEQEFEGPRDAADELSVRRREPMPVIARNYTDKNDEPVDAAEAITLERGARDLAALRNGESDAAREEAAAKLRDELDRLRGDHIPNRDANDLESDPAKPDTKDVRDAGEKPAAEAAADGKLDSTLAEALRHPQVVQAIEQRLGVAETARKSYAEALGVAQDFARASFMENFPELAAVPPQQLQPALEMMAQRQPERFGKAMATLDRVGKLQAAQQAQQQHQSAAARQQFESFAKAEDGRLDTMLKGESSQTQRAVMDEIMAGAKEAGVEPVEFIRLFHSDPLMRNAHFQKMMYDAGKYRLAQKTTPKAAARDVPLVQRPGVAASRTSANTATISALTTKLDRTGSLRDAQALLAAQRRANAKG
jgi:hypothetical protein